MLPLNVRFAEIPRKKRNKNKKKGKHETKQKNDITKNVDSKHVQKQTGGPYLWLGLSFPKLHLPGGSIGKSTSGREMHIARGPHLLPRAVFHSFQQHPKQAPKGTLKEHQFQRDLQKMGGTLESPLGFLPKVCKRGNQSGCAVSRRSSSASPYLVRRSECPSSVHLSQHRTDLDSRSRKQRRRKASPSGRKKKSLYSRG